MSDATYPPMAGTSGLAVQALRCAHGGPFTFVVPRGGCVAVTGPSGSGKTVLLRMIADLDPHEGVARIDGLACPAMPAPQWRRLVQYVPAEPAWWSDAVLDHMADTDTVRDLVGRLGLRADCLHRPLSRLSTGERQRLALIRSLLLHPRALLLDEPCSALDAATTDRVEAVLHAVREQGTAIVLVSHDMQQAGRMAAGRFQMAQGHMEEIAP
ncbi:Putative ABC transporter ATP-binding protein ybbL [Gluconacetobacter sp. SXCC-1]|nr:ATP-binding cassette domain-containing protein [Komagataeibacter rhaeticus]ATU72874.1 ATP-binding protein [Komagataeibacter xylinus]EGG76692.1 Putative ABC transporter ATP-binding protein ybbL [Gluconacetobacter sp. SXCC-1]WPP22663.1 ATP-binding cassette domain-containing protein [Komagataeibacter rhaeticus]SAY46783.1 putative ABC transporter ATP-binding protein YbbL [Komagataeibacter rhaeticus]